MRLTLVGFLIYIVTISLDSYFYKRKFIDFYSIQSQKRRNPAANPDICPNKLIPGRNDQMIPIPVSNEIDLDNLRSFLISHLMKANLSLP